MPSNTPLHRADPPSRRHLRLAGAIAAATLALTLAACGSSQADAVQEIAATAAAEADIPQALEDYAESLGTTEIPSQDEVREKYDAWLASKTGTDETESPDGPDEALAVGDCTDHIPTGAEDAAADIAAVGCDGEHLTEVYLSLPLGQLGAEFPANADIFEAATQGCAAGFEEYIGLLWADSVNSFAAVTPTRASWQDGDTNVLCLAYPLSLNSFTGTLQGSHQ